MSGDKVLHKLNTSHHHLKLKDIEVVKIPPNFPLFIWDQCSSAIHPIRAATNSKYKVARINDSEFCIAENQKILLNHNYRTVPSWGNSLQYCQVHNNIKVATKIKSKILQNLTHLLYYLLKLIAKNST